MTGEQTFVIRRGFLVPLGLLLLEILALLVICLVQQQPIAKVVILVGLTLPIAGLFVESCFRRLVLDADRLTAKRLLREKTLHLAEITDFDTVIVRNRVYLTLTAGDEFLILSNSYADFPRLVNGLIERIPPDVVSEATRRMAEAPPRKTSDIVSGWLGVVLLVYILYAQF